jgi:hypothetical protein
VVKPLLPDLALGSLARHAPGSARPAHGHGRVSSTWLLRQPPACLHITALVLGRHRLSPKWVSSGLTELKESDPRVGCRLLPGGSAAAARVVGAAPPGVCPAGLWNQPAQQVQQSQNGQERTDGRGRDACWLAAGQDRWSGRGRRGAGRGRPGGGRRPGGGGRPGGGCDAGRGHQRGRGHCRGRWRGGGGPGRGRWRGHGGLGGDANNGRRRGYCRATDGGRRGRRGRSGGRGRSADGSPPRVRSGGKGWRGGRLPGSSGGGRRGRRGWLGWHRRQRDAGDPARRFGLGRQGGRGHQSGQDRGGEPEDEQQQSPGPPWPCQMPRGWRWHGASSWFGWFFRLLGCPCKPSAYRPHTT